MAAAPTSMHITGTAYIACNCDWGCPCNFNALPSKGNCEGGWTWQIDKGDVGGVKLDGLTFSLLAKWPGAIHEGNGEHVMFIDERATAEQRAAIETLAAGKCGGPWAILAWTWPKAHGIFPVPYEIVKDGVKSSIKCGDQMSLVFTSIKNPVNGSEAFPRMILPQGLIVKEGDLGASETFKLNSKMSFDHSGQYTALGPFDYQWSA